MPHVALLLLRRPLVGGEAPFFPFSRVRVEDDLLFFFSFAGRQWGMEGWGGEERRREGTGERGGERGGAARLLVPWKRMGGDRSRGLALSAREGVGSGQGVCSREGEGVGLGE